MGKKLIGFLIWNKYECSHCIPYPCLMATTRGNGCLQAKPENDRWLSREWKPDEKLPIHIQYFRNNMLMVDLCELLYFGYYSVDYHGGEDVKLFGEGSKNKLIPEKTEEDEDVDVER